ncbi:MAG: extracellular solute-binding protein [Clostridiales bacterium]|nr:extracellular solute-binding protein [Clostridiales bacterium]
MKKKSIMSLSLAAAMLLGMTGCSSSETTAGSTTTIPNQIETTTAPSETEEGDKGLGYEFGLGTTFHSDEPVTYTMFFSDASWYAKQDTWESEGVFKKIEELTNVHLDIISYDSNDYMSNVTLEINAGNAAYIIPKIYDDSAFVDGGAIVPASDYVQYMPNFVDFYNKYNMADDIKTITRSNGKYYKFPGMLEAQALNYCFVIRQDIFKAAGVDVETLEKDWTWETLLETLKTVKAYMVSQGMCSETDYIWSDLWCGGESGQGSGGNLLKVMGITYDVNAGWAIADGMRYDQAKDEWYFSPITDEYKEFLKMANAFVEAGILDPETFTQDDTQATNKFYNGETVIMSMNQSQFGPCMQNCDEMLGAGKYELFLAIPPRSDKFNYSTAGNVRLENGVMVSQKALDDLGPDGFIKLCRFVDWLFYSPEAYTLIKWGIEGETFEYTADGGKQLKEGMYCGGLGYSMPEGADGVDIRLKWGYAGGNFWYGHTIAEMSDNYIPQIKRMVSSNSENRETPPLAPGIAPTEEQNEQITLIATPLIDEVNAWTLNFVIGQKKIDEQWDEYVAVCKDKNCEGLVSLYNEIYKG